MRDLLRRHILDPTFDDWLGTHHFGSAGDTPEEWTTDPDQRAQALSLPTDVGETPAVPLVLVTPALGVVKSVNRGTRFAHRVPLRRSKFAWAVPGENKSMRPSSIINF